MESLKSYIMELVIVAITCGIVCGIVKEGSAQKVLKLVCGIFLTVTMLRPLAGATLDHLMDIPESFTDDAARAVSSGESLARNSEAEIIKQKCEAYILDKASELDLSLAVDITLSEEDPPVPIAVRICGNITPYNKLLLEELILQNLGITKENQLWTG